MRFKWLSVVSMVVLLLGACGTPDAGTADDQADVEKVQESIETADEGTDQAEESEQAETRYPLTVTDDSGTEVTIEQEPQTMISVLPSNTEIVFALGLDEEVIAVTDNDDSPEEVNDKEKVGGMELNVEKIVSLEPDLVFAGLLNGDVVQKLRDLGVTVLVSEGESLADTYASIELIGKVTNRAAEAEAIVNGMKEDVSQVEEWVSNIPDEKRLSVWWEDDPELFTPGAGTMMDELITIAGGKNVAAKELDGWGQLSEEKVVEFNPDVIVGTYGEDQVKEAVADRQAWSEINAVKNGRVYGIDSSLVSRPGPRLTEGLRELAKLFYPDAVEDAP